MPSTHPLRLKLKCAESLFKIIGAQGGGERSKGNKEQEETYSPLILKINFMIFTSKLPK